MLEQEVTTIPSPGKILGWQRAVLFKIFAKLEFGQLRVYDGGRLIDVFGEKTSDLTAVVRVKNDRFYSKLLFGGSIGVGESYVDGDWETPDLTSVVRVFARNLSVLDKIEAQFSWLTLPLNKWKHWGNKNSQKQAQQNISAHYDLGNELYKSFLDQRMLYSSAIFRTSDQSLEEAQVEKLRTICTKLDLKNTDHVVEIGTGWGALAIYMAEEYGCTVTTTTISDEQYHYTKELIVDKKLADKVNLLKKDYRELNGKYDKLVSIEMIEAVGKEYMDQFFEKCEDLLKPKGKMLIQAITIADQRLSTYESSVDYIQKYIFPGGFLPSLSLLTHQIGEKVGMAVRDVHDIGLDYAKTLNVWRERFEQNFSSLSTRGYDERFFRMWKFYLEYCEGGFLERTISTVQVVATKKSCLASVTRNVHSI